MRRRGIGGPELPPGSALCVTVPGAPALWEDTVKTFGKLDLKQVWVLNRHISAPSTAYCLIMPSARLPMKSEMKVVAQSCRPPGN